jgi:hypothetical protein
LPHILGFINGIRPISDVTLIDIRKIFITILIGEKFCYGYLANSVNNGLVLNVLKRLKDIRGQRLNQLRYQGI